MLEAEEACGRLIGVREYFATYGFNMRVIDAEERELNLLVEKEELIKRRKEFVRKPAKYTKEREHRQSMLMQNVRDPCYPVDGEGCHSNTPN